MGFGSRAFEAAGALMSKPAMRPLTRTFSNLHAALYRLTRGAASNPNYPTMLLTVTGRKSGAIGSLISLSANGTNKMRAPLRDTRTRFCRSPIRGGNAIKTSARGHRSAATRSRSSTRPWT